MYPEATLFITFTQSNIDIQVYLKVETWEQSKEVDFLSPNREYEFKMMAFTGPHPDNVTFSSNNVSAKTQQGGMLLSKM